MSNVGFVTRLGSVHERLMAMEPSLAAGSPRYMAGVLLLALQEGPPRVDLLAVRLGQPREFVAKCLRRLIDNGVVQNGGLVVGWSGETWSEQAFWADVQVALGTWWRRQDGSGRLEWIEAGGWQKPYEYVDRGTGYLAVPKAQPRLGLDLFTAGTNSFWIGSQGGDSGGFLSSPAPDFPEVGSTWSDGLGGEPEAPAESDEAAVVPAGEAAEVVWLF